MVTEQVGWSYKVFMVVVAIVNHLIKVADGIKEAALAVAPGVTLLMVRKIVWMKLNTP